MNLNLMFSSKSQEQLTNYAAVPLRLIVGYGFLEHGMAKWAKGPDTFAAILQTTHVPAPHVMAWLTIIAEFFGGLAILLGAFVAWVSVPTILLLAVAIVTVHLPYGFSSIKLLKIVDGRAQFGPLATSAICSISPASWRLCCVARVRGRLMPTVCPGTGPLCVEELLPLTGAPSG